MVAPAAVDMPPAAGADVVEAVAAGAALVLPGLVLGWVLGWVLDGG